MEHAEKKNEAAALNQALDNLAKLKEESDKKVHPEPKVVGQCVVCQGGKVTELLNVQYCSGTFNAVVDGYYCDQCGLSYARPPKVRRNVVPFIGDLWSPV